VVQLAGAGQIAPGILVTVWWLCFVDCFFEGRICSAPSGKRCILSIYFTTSL